VGFHLRTRDSALPWSFSGYGTPRTMPADATVAAVTPAHVRAALAAGYRPLLHPSAEGQLSAR
jgi:hypothetical protein